MVAVMMMVWTGVGIGLVDQGFFVEQAASVCCGIAPSVTLVFPFTVALVSTGFPCQSSLSGVFLLDADNGVAGRSRPCEKHATHPLGIIFVSFDLLPDSKRLTSKNRLQLSAALTLSGRSRSLSLSLSLAPFPSLFCLLCSTLLCSYPPSDVEPGICIFAKAVGPRSAVFTYTYRKGFPPISQRASRMPHLTPRTCSAPPTHPCLA